MTTALPKLPVIVVPGKGNSESTHWQSWLERRLLYVERVRQRDWTQPVLDEWADNVASAIVRAERPPLVVAHSFGCLATAYALLRHADTLPAVAGAILVAPADPRRFALNEEELLHPLPCRSLVVVSSNDPWMSKTRALRFANAWQASTHHAGRVGHMNVASGFGPWPRMLRWIENWQPPTEAPVPPDVGPSAADHLRETVRLMTPIIRRGRGILAP